MTITTISRVRTISKKLPIGSDAIFTIYENRAETIKNQLLPESKYQLISCNAFIRNLKLKSTIKSIPEAPLPVFPATASDTEKLQITLDIEWKSPRKNANLLLSSAPGVWDEIAYLSLLNVSGYPFRTYNIMDAFTDNLAIDLGDNGQVGIQISNVNYGLLTEVDSVVAYGSVVEEITVSSADPVPTGGGIIIGGSNVPATRKEPVTVNVTEVLTPIISAMPNRIKWGIKNIGNNRVILNYPFLDFPIESGDIFIDDIGWNNDVLAQTLPGQTTDLLIHNYLP